MAWCAREERFRQLGSPGVYRKTTARGAETSDPDGWLVRAACPDGQAVSFAYNGEGQRTAITAPHGVTSFTYDLRGRLATIATPDGQQLQFGCDGFLQDTITFYGTAWPDSDWVNENAFGSPPATARA